jgi:hypothetical protein
MGFWSCAALVVVLVAVGASARLGGALSDDDSTYNPSTALAFVYFSAIAYCDQVGRGFAMSILLAGIPVLPPLPKKTPRPEPTPRRRATLAGCGAHLRSTHMCGV